MDITTNRVDAMNHYGIAREAATIYNLPLAPLDTALPAAQPTAQPFPVEIAADAKHLCGRFSARVLRNVTIALHRRHRRVLRSARLEADLERRRCIELRPARHGASHARV